jgi:hypothetical protein
MSRPKIDFEKELKQLITRLEGVVSNVSQKSAVAESSSNGNNSKVVSCQLVNFNSESKNHNEYQVYNYCHSVKIYENELANYFTLKDKKGNFINKSVLSIFKDMDDDGVWYSQKEKKYTPKIIALEYNKPAPTTAVYEKYSLEKECRKQWKNWSNLMYTIYKDQAVSVFAKKIEIPISDSRTLYSGIYLTFACKLSYSQIGIIGRICGNLLNEIAFKDLMPGLYEDIENQATRAAISQVMARNTSHNIGAHVMNKLIGDLSKVEIEKFENYKWGVELYKDETDSNKKLLDQISIFNNYVKCRMDYLADISFGTPLMQTNKYAYADLFKELDKVRLLLEHISGLDNFKFQIKFQKNGKDLDENYDLLVAIPNDILGTQAFYNILENIIRNSAKHSQKPAEKDENGNSITTTTVFTINFIDEIAGVNGFCSDEKCDRTKCNKAHKKEIENALNEFIAVEVYDDIPVNNNADLKPEEVKEYNDKTGKSEKKIHKIDYLVFSQNKKLNEDILQENKLRSYSLGLVEMDASAAYLRKRPVEYINHRSYDIQYDESWSRNTDKNEKDKIGLRGTNCRHFLKAFKKTEGDKNYLGYRFFLHRPAVVLVVTKEVPANKEELKKQGVWVVTKEEFEKHLKPEYGKKDGKVYPHEFVVIDSDVKFEKVKIEIVEKNNDGQEKKNIEVIEFLEYYKTSLPIRVLKVECGELHKLFVKKGSILNDWEQFCWKKSVTNIIPILGGYVSTFSQQAVYLNHLFSEKSEQTPTQMWQESIKADHLEALSSLAQSKLPDFNKYTKSEIGTEHILKKYLERITTPKDELINGKNVTTRENAYFKIIEAVQKKVIVIDERIQNTTKESSDGGKEFMTIPYKELYAKMGVIVPNKSLNLSENSFETIKTRVEEYIEKEISKVKATDFILIHYSILERMYEKDEIKTKIDKWAKNINVVVTSGRGIPNDLSEKVRFVNLSSVITAFVDVRSKYAINYLLNSSRKSNKI